MSRFDRIQSYTLRKAREAVERQEAYNKLTIAQKFERLDQKLGSGVGAARQRTRLAQQLQFQAEEAMKKVQSEEKRQAKRGAK